MPEFPKKRDPFEPSYSDKGLSLDAFLVSFLLKHQVLKNPETKMKQLPLCIFWYGYPKNRMFWKRWLLQIWPVSWASSNFIGVSGLFWDPLYVPKSLETFRRVSKVSSFSHCGACWSKGAPWIFLDTYLEMVFLLKLTPSTYEATFTSDSVCSQFHSLFFSTKNTAGMAEVTRTLCSVFREAKNRWRFPKRLLRIDGFKIPTAMAY